MTPEQAAFIVIVAFAIGLFMIVYGGTSFIRSNPALFETRSRIAHGLLFCAAGAMFVGGVGVHLTGSSNTAFLKGQLARVSSCELEGETAYPTARGGASGVISRHIVGCMKAAGYEWADVAARCQEAPVATNAYCYAPAAWFDRAITTAQLAFD